MIYALYIEQKITIFALYTKHKYKNQINNLTMENELQVIGTKEVEERIIAVSYTHLTLPTTSRV